MATLTLRPLETCRFGRVWPGGIMPLLDPLETRIHTIRPLPVRAGGDEADDLAASA